MTTILLPEFLSEDTGHYIYKCHSERCGFTGTIIECVEKLHNETRPDALNFLRKVYRITYTETDWQKRQKLILEENKRVIYSNEFEEFYPNLYKRIRNHLSELYILNDLFKDYVITEIYSDNDNNALVFKSMREIAATFDKTLNNTQRKSACLLFSDF